MKKLLLLGLVALAGLAPFARGQHGHGTTTTPSTPDWSDQTVRDFEAIPIQDGGRVKPLRTFAGYTLLRMNGKRTFVPPDAESDRDKRPASEWLLDVLLQPEAANHFETFIVPDDEVIQALGLVKPEGKKKRDRYSYAFLLPARERLRELALQIEPIDEKARSTTQQHLYDLFGAMTEYERLAGALDFARFPFSFEAIPDAASLFAEPGNVGFVEITERYPDLQVLYATISADPARRSELERLGSILNTVGTVASLSRRLAILPPAEAFTGNPTDDAWYTPEDVLAVARPEAPAAEEHLAALASLAHLVEVRDDPAAVEAEIGSLLGRIQERAEARGEYDKIPLELTYYRAKLITRSLMLFLLAFVCGAFLWLVPKSRVLLGATWLSAGGGTLLLITAIVFRCLIRERPPVSTLYETLLFVTAVGATVALFIEYVGRQRIAVTAAATLGSVGLYLANGFEKIDKSDTMPSLVAVLDTNFWLATHVTTITIGYSAGILGALFGSVYVVAKAFGLKRNDPAFFASVARMTYGIVCFGLVFSIVGTILGGIWANDSWGRFWGWDPKENGALLICLANIAILHLRAGGFLRDLGLCTAAAFTGIVVSFSWFHVNLLEVGLHTYGFTGGIKRALFTYYGIQGGVVLLGVMTALFQRSLAPAGVPSKVQLESEPGGGDVPAATGLRR